MKEQIKNNATITGKFHQKMKRILAAPTELLGIEKLLREIEEDKLFQDFIREFAQEYQIRPLGAGFDRDSYGILAPDKHSSVYKTYFHVCHWNQNGCGRNLSMGLDSEKRVQPFFFGIAAPLLSKEGEEYGACYPDFLVDSEKDGFYLTLLNKDYGRNVPSFSNVKGRVLFRNTPFADGISYEDAKQQFLKEENLFTTLPFKELDVRNKYK